MKLTFSAADELFREEVADWLNDNLTGEFAEVRYRGGPGDEHHFVTERKAWERRLAVGTAKLGLVTPILDSMRRNAKMPFKVHRDNLIPVSFR